MRVHLSFGETATAEEAFKETASRLFAQMDIIIVQPEISSIA